MEGEVLKFSNLPFKQPLKNCSILQLPHVAVGINNENKHGQLTILGYMHSHNEVNLMYMYDY